MLEVLVSGIEYYDECLGRFLTTDDYTLQIEHSLTSISKWESIWHKPFLSDTPKTTEEALDYIRCMSLNPQTPLNVYDRLSPHNIASINAYMDDKQTATWFAKNETIVNREIITAEVIYYWMIALTIPREYETWHFNKLMTLIKVCNVKNGSGKKMSRREVLTNYHTLNQQRLAQMSSQ